MSLTMKKVKPIILIVFLGLFIMPINILFSSITVDTDQSNDIDEKTIENNPLTQAAPDLDAFYINGTEYYEQNTYYLFQNDTLVFIFKNDTAADNVYLELNHTTIPAQDFLFSLQQNPWALDEWNRTVDINSTFEVGKFNATLKYGKGGDSRTFKFYLEVMNPAPRIVYLEMTDSTYHLNPMEIVEGGTYTTYRGTSLSLTACVMNKDGLGNLGASSGELFYKKNLAGSWQSVVLTEGALHTYNGLPVKNYSTLVALTITPNTNDDWMPGTYPMYINATDDKDASYIFEFNLTIMNTPPQITELSVNPSFVTDKSASKATITVDVNASDLEDDLLYYTGGALRKINYTDRVAMAENISDCVSLNENSTENSIRYDESIDATKGYVPHYNLSVPGSAALGQFSVNFTISSEINNITQFAFNFRIKDNISCDTYQRLMIWNYDTPGWETVGTNFDLDAGSSFTYITLYVTSNCEDYVVNTSKVQIMLEYQESSTDETLVVIDYINITTTVETRATFSSVRLYVYTPFTLESQSFEIKNYWRTDLNIWRYDMEICMPCKEEWGSLSLVVIVTDYGYHEYWSPTIWGNYSVGDPFSSIDKEPKYFPSKSRATASTSQVIGMGIATGDVLNFTAGNPTPIINNTNPAYNDDVNITVFVNDPNSPNTNLTGSKAFNATEIKLQYNTSITYSQGDEDAIDSSHKLYGNTSLTKNNDNDPFNFTMNEQIDGNHERNQSAIVRFSLRTPWWLQDNFTSVQIDLDNYFEDNASIDTVYVEFWDFANSKWITPSSGNWDSSSDWSLEDKKDDSTGGKKFTQTWSDNAQIRNCINLDFSLTNQLVMRIRATAAAQDTPPINMSIDFVQVTVNWNSYHGAYVSLNSYSYESENYITEHFNMTRLNLTSTTTQYSFLFNQETVMRARNDKFWSGNYLVDITVQNGNSTFRILRGRKTSVQLGTNQYEKMTYYNTAEEINFINDEVTIKVDPRPLTYSEAYLNNLSIYRYKDQFFANGTLILNSTWKANQFKFDLRYGTDSVVTDSDWTEYIRDALPPEFTYSDAQDKWDFNIGVFPKNTIPGAYFVRMFLETVEGQTIATDWRELRILNNPPIDFQVSLAGAESLFRTNNLSFDWTFTDLDDNTDIMNYKKAIYMDIHNRFTDQDERWNTNCYFTKVLGPTFTYHCEILLDRHIDTGMTSVTIDSIYFELNDTDSTQPQVSWLNYTGTQLEIKNNAPTFQLDVTSNITAGSQLFRENGIQFQFNVSDVDDIYYQNITVVNCSLWFDDNWVLSPTDGQISYDVADNRREYDYHVLRNSALGTLNFSIIANDTDGRTVKDDYQIVIVNNIPVIVNVSYNDNLNLAAVGVYRNNETLRVRIAIQDIEDSWLGDNYVDSVAIIINHSTYTNGANDPWIINMQPMVEGKASNNYTETWGRNIVFNVSQSQGIFYAGDLRMTININDSDTSNANSYGHVLKVLNAVPTTTTKKVWDMTTSKEWYIPNNITEDNDLNITIFVSDHEGLYLIKITYLQGGTEATAQTLSLDFGVDDWDTGTVNGTSYVSIIFEASSLEIDSFLRIKWITIYDIDHGHKHATELGATELRKAPLQNIDILSKIPIGPETNPFEVLAWVGIISSIGAVAVVGVWYWRKKMGYRKYMD